MAKIYIDRSSEKFNGGTPYQIYIDNEKVGTVGNGEDKYFEVIPGEHTVVAKMNSFMGSPNVSVTVKGDEVKALKTNGISGVIGLMILGAVSIGIIYLQDFFPVVKQYLYIILPGLFALFFLTIGKNKFLTLKLVEKRIAEGSVELPVENNSKLAKIYIDRPSEFFNRTQPCQIYIDDKKVGTVGSGEEKYFELEQGEHTIAAKMGIANSSWMGGSPKVLVTVKRGGNHRLKLSGMNGLLWLLATIATAVVITIVMEKYFSVDMYNKPGEKLYSLVVYLVVFALSYFAYGKKNYLTLTLKE